MTRSLAILSPDYRDRRTLVILRRHFWQFADNDRSFEHNLDKRRGNSI